MFQWVIHRVGVKYKTSALVLVTIIITKAGYIIALLDYIESNDNHYIRKTILSLTSVSFI